MVTSEVVQVREPLTNSPERGRDREAQLQPLAKVVYPTVPWWQSGEIQILMVGFSPTSQTKAESVWICLDLCRSVAYGLLVYSAIDIVLGQP